LRLSHALGLTAVLIVGMAMLHAPERALAAKPPSIVLIVTDDQRWDTLWALPTVTAELVDRGLTFTNAFVTNPLCCPSRATILTGRYSHGTGVYANHPPHGGLPAFDDSSTIATWLHAAGYRTGFFGKYLNGYGGTYIPPGWDRWLAFSGRLSYFDYRVNDDGTVRRVGSDEADYSTDVVAAGAVEFIEGATGPVFLLLSPYAPHIDGGGWRRGNDPVPAPRHADTFPDLPPWRPPSFDEADVSDKPPWIQDLFLTGELVERIDRIRRAQLQSLQAVDEAVGRIISALEETGRLENSVIVFTSDNGFSLGEHRWVAKTLPYEESIRVPMVVRSDGRTPPGGTSDRPVVNVDLAPTLAKLAGVRAPGAQGKSLIPLLRGTDAALRSDFVLESASGTKPSYCGIRSTRHTYTQYRGGFEELYDLVLDPYQLRNRSSLGHSRQQIVAFRRRVIELCEPRPPGMTPLSPCLVVGTSGPDDLIGTRWYDLVCGGQGDDRISAGRGDDEAEGGTGSDSIAGGKGGDALNGGREPDDLRAGPGHDRVQAAGNGRDTVACGLGVDVAIVDARDKVTSCERVRRS
jgi:N-acetylglucosamine-6-sulfatase